VTSALPPVTFIDVARPGDVPKGLSVAIGSFDGVHVGHQHVIETAVKVARERRVGAGVICFDPHPHQFLFPNGAPFRLMTLNQQVRAFSELGVDQVLVIRFNAALSSLSADQFAHEVLHDLLGVTHVSAGFDFSFGKRGQGKAEDLIRFGEELGFTTHVLPCQVDEAGDKLASSAVRDALEAGDFEQAAHFLGRPQAFEGVVAHGDKIGRTLGFPTLNVDLGTYQRPRYGVYVSRTRLADGRVFGSVTNLGTRPTIGGVEERFETWVFDFDEDIYGQTVEIEVLHFLRGDVKFDSLDALKAQVQRDGDEARAWLQSA
jgi:riboflavin kinase/FMN adenylyltransferase